MLKYCKGFRFSFGIFCVNDGNHNYIFPKCMVGRLFFLSSSVTASNVSYTNQTN